ncbi:MAG: HEAT repeat domain-containing protein [Bradyrhizobium sp.]|nr:HEAT repeat domain-containing protein [Bradyrhizobium sp.]
MASAAFERFRFSFFEDKNSARDGLAIPALSQLQGEEAAQAEAMLIGLLPDTRAVIGLGILRSRRAEPELTRMFEAEQPARRKATGDEPWPTDQLVYLAKSLWRIRPDRRWLDAILGVLASGGDWQRQMAAEELRGVGDPVVVPALIRTLDDSEPLVRHHAARGLLEMHGLSTESLDPAHMMYRIMSDDAARRERGKQDILAAIDGRPIGEPWSVRGS